MGKRYFTFQQLLLTLVNLFTFSFCCYYIVHLIYVYNTERDTVIEDMIYRKKEGAALGDVFRRAKRTPKNYCASTSVHYDSWHDANYSTEHLFLWLKNDSLLGRRSERKPSLVKGNVRNCLRTFLTVTRTLVSVQTVYAWMCWSPSYRGWNAFVVCIK